MLKKYKILTSILLTLVMALSISSVAMAKGGDKPPAMPSINITGEGIFYATPMFDSVVSEVYQYEGKISARTTKSGFLDLDISFKSDIDNGFRIEGDPEDTSAMVITGISVSTFIPEGEYLIEQLPNPNDKKLIQTTVWTDAPLTIAYKEIVQDPVTLEVKVIDSGTMTVLAPVPVVVGDNIFEFDMMFGIKDIVLFDEIPLFFIADHDTLNQQR